jgi:hypothetical protein
MTFTLLNLNPPLPVNASDAITNEISLELVLMAFLFNVPVDFGAYTSSMDQRRHNRSRYHQRIPEINQFPNPDLCLQQQQQYQTDQEQHPSRYHQKIRLQRLSSTPVESKTLDNLLPDFLPVHTEGLISSFRNSVYYLCCLG